jgi:hypothetical protein
MVRTLRTKYWLISLAFRISPRSVAKVDLFYGFCVR